MRYVLVMLSALSLAACQSVPHTGSSGGNTFNKTRSEPKTNYDNPMCPDCGGKHPLPVRDIKDICADCGYPGHPLPLSEPTKAKKATNKTKGKAGKANNSKSRSGVSSMTGGRETGQR